MRQQRDLIVILAVALALLLWSGLAPLAAPPATAQTGHAMPPPDALPHSEAVVDVSPLVQANSQPRKENTVQFTDVTSDTAQVTDVTSSTARIATRLEMFTVTTLGYVEVPCPSDTATVQIDIKTLEPTLDAALKKNFAQITETQQLLQKDLAIPTDAIVVTDPQIAPVLGEQRTITGYRVLTPIKVTASLKGQGTDIIAQIVKLGGSSFNEIKFSVKDPLQCERRARELAFGKARIWADQYAQLATQYAQRATFKLGRIVSISEDVSSRKEPFPWVPGAPKEQIFSAHVSVEFELVNCTVQRTLSICST